MEAYAARVTVVYLGFRLLDCGEPVSEHRLADEGDGVEPESRVEWHGNASGKHQLLRICERRLDVLLADDLLDRDQGVFEFGNIPNVGEDEAEYPSS